MKADFRYNDQITYFVFIGEAGCGKSEIAINLAYDLAAEGKKPVHFFDMDMTKPLFRSRDKAKPMEDAGITVHFERQFFDAPTLIGGVRPIMIDPDVYTILDIGGDYMGARTIGGFAPVTNRDNTGVYYVVNSYRPWSATLEHIDGVLSQVLGVSHIQLAKRRFIGNPNLGVRTVKEDVLKGIEETEKLLGDIVPVDFYCAKREIAQQLPEELKIYPIDQQLVYFWEDDLA